MVTKTLTITEDAYNLLVQHKYQGESFSQELRRIFSKKKHKTLMDFFGILSDEEGQGILDALEQQKKTNIQFQKKRFQDLWGVEK